MPDALPCLLDSTPLALDSWSQKLSFYFVHSNAGWMLLAGLLALTGFYSLVWYRRRGRQLVKIDYRHLDQALPPDVVRYIWVRGYDSKSLLAAILNASVKGCYRIHWQVGGFVARRTALADFSKLSQGERAALGVHGEQLWEEVTVTRKRTMRTRKMSDRQERYLRRKYGKLFLSGFWPSAVGIAFSIAMLIAVFVIEGQQQLLPHLGLFLGLMGVFVITPLIFLKQIIGDRYWLGIFHACLFLTVGVIGLYVVESGAGTPLYSAAGIPFFLVNAFFLGKLDGDAPEGRKWRMMMMGYRRHLAHRLDLVAAGQLSLSDMASEMPYVIALDLDHRITGYFDQVLTQSRYVPYQLLDRMHG